MSNFEKPTTQSTTSTATQGQHGASFFKPKLQPSFEQMQEILRQSEAPIRAWLNKNMQRVSMYSEADLVTLIRKDVSEATSMADGNIRSALRSWASENQVTIPRLSVVPLGPQTAPKIKSSGGLQWPHFQFSLGSFSFSVQLPSEAVAKLPLKLSQRHSITFKLSAEVPGNFSFLAAYDGIPELRIGLRSSFSLGDKMPFSASLFLESNRKVCQARNRAQLEKSLQDAGNDLKKAIEEVQSFPTPKEGESDFAYAKRWADVGIKIAALQGEIESTIRNQCKEQPGFSFDLGVKTPFNPPDQPKKQEDAPFFGASATWHF